MSFRLPSKIKERMIRMRSQLRTLRLSKVVVVPYPHPIAAAQWHPVIMSCPSARLVTPEKARDTNTWRRSRCCRIVLLQSHWDQDEGKLGPIIDAIRKSRPEVKLVYLDWYAPLHIPQPWLLDRVDLYVKKQALVDRSKYAAGMHDTNLVEYEAQWSARFRNTKWLKVDAHQLAEKLFVGWNFATDIHRISQLTRRLYDNVARPFDLHCRICAPPVRDSWYAHMRGRAYDAIRALETGPLSSASRVCTTERLTYNDYLREISHSKLCFSPFGFGEVCWRDFESILAGAGLVKPAMSHLVTHPNVFQPHVTYIPVNWEFTDLAEQCRRYLDDEEARHHIVNSAVVVWTEFLQDGWQSLWQSMLRRLQVEPIPVGPLITR